MDRAQCRHAHGVIGKLSAYWFELLIYLITCCAHFFSSDNIYFSPVSLYVTTKCFGAHSRMVPQDFVCYRFAHVTDPRQWKNLALAKFDRNSTNVRINWVSYCSRLFLFLWKVMLISCGEKLPVASVKNPKCKKRRKKRHLSTAMFLDVWHVYCISTCAVETM